MICRSKIKFCANKKQLKQCVLLDDLPAFSTGFLLAGEEAGPSAELLSAAFPGRKGWVQV